jgi:hypothetical protein
MLRNHFGAHVPSDLLLLEDAQRIKKYFSSLAVCHFNYYNPVDIEAGCTSVRLV